LVERIALGPVAQVWRARSAQGHACIVKFPIEGLAEHRGAARLIEREWTLLKLASQPGVVTAVGLVDACTGPGLMTEFLPGGDLVPLAGSDARHWAAAASDVAATVQGLHARGLVHRDLKLRNVLFDAGGRATLIDFALAGRIGDRGIGGGTAAYRRPDQRGGDAATPAEDVYAFAVMIYELLRCVLPFGREPGCFATPPGPAVALERLAGDATEPRVAALAELVASVLQAEPEDPAAVLQEFQRVLQAIIRRGHA
jgi:serine/threonine protein kinase